MKRPTVLYPTIVKGVIHAKEIRCESIDGSELWIPGAPDGVLHLQNVKPFVHTDGKTYFITHLQKRAKYFYLRYDPFIIHQGYCIKPQKLDANGQPIPGTEIFPYWRSPGWRWQRPDEKSEGTPWIFSGGRILGLHLD